MNKYVLIVLIWLVSLQATATEVFPGVWSEGSLSFRSNGILYTASSTHARGYAVKQTAVAYINGANKENMVIGIEWKNVKEPGTFLIKIKEGKADFTINHKTYSVKQAGNYMKVVISDVKQQGAFLLLSGTFEGELQDKNGNKVNITEGKFSTYSL